MNQEQLNRKLINAAENDDLKEIKELLKQGADIHAEDDDALIFACNYGYLEVVKFLIESGANVHAQNNQTLINAASWDCLEMVKYLIIEHGCDPQVALINAKEHDCLETAEWCEKYIRSKDLNNKLEIDLSQNSDKINNNKMKV